MIKKIIRTSILISFLAAVLFMGKSKWIEFRDKPVRERFSHPFYRKAVDYFREVLKMVPFAAGHYALAESYLDEGLENQAVEEYKKTLEMDKRFVQAYLALANIYYRRESSEEAWDLIQKAEAVIQDNPDIKDLKKQASYGYFLERGVKAFEGGDRIKARELFNQALASGPDSAQLHYLIALTFDEQQDFYRVEDYLKKAISLDPKFYLARNFLGDICFGKGDFVAAVEQYRASLDANRDDPYILNNLGLAYMNLQRYGSALPSLERALALDPNNIEFYHNLATVYRDYGMLDKATEGFTKIIQLKPDDPNVYNDLGDIYRKQGQDKEALKQYRAGIECGKKLLSSGIRDPSLLVNLAHAYNGAQEFQTAKDLVEEALLKDSNDPRVYMTLADAYKGLRRSDAALIALDKAKNLSPKNSFFIDEAITHAREQLAKEQQAKEQQAKQEQ
ncbi:MAG: tetratricopeptide repeat protein [Candidatus Omnitrophota bacterium]